MAGTTDMQRRLGVVLGDLSSMLWTQRAQFERVLYLLAVMQALLETDRHGLIEYATSDLEVASDELRQAELVRSVQVQAVADLLQSPDACGINSLIQHSPSPWGVILTEHRTALAKTMRDVALLTTLPSDRAPTLDDDVFFADLFSSAAAPRMSLLARLDEARASSLGVPGLDAAVTAVRGVIPDSLNDFI